jgi:hypothetical protein
VTVELQRQGGVLGGRQRGEEVEVLEHETHLPTTQLGEPACAQAADLLALDDDLA